MRILFACVLVLAGCGAAKKGGDMALVGDLASRGLELEPNPAKQGHIMVWGYRFQSGSMHTSMMAQFGTSDGKPGPCSSEMIDACVVEVCPISDAGVAELTMLNTVDAGMMTLNGVGAPIVFASNATGDVDRSWTGGEKLTMQASGAAVPAFSIDVMAPLRTYVLTPANPPNSVTIPVTRSVGFDVTWQPVAQGQMQIVLERMGVTVTCTVAGDKGAYTVPPGALARLPASVDANAGTVAHATTTAGGFAIDMTTLAPAQDQASGYLWGAVLTLQ